MPGQPPGKLVEAIHAYRELAREAIDDRPRVEHLLEEAKRAAAQSAVLQERLGPLRHLVRSHVRGAYAGADPADVLWALAAVMYVASPWDLAPDYLPGGLRDDELAAKWVIDRITKTLLDYGEWERAEFKAAQARSRPTQLSRAVDPGS